MRKENNCKIKTYRKIMIIIPESLFFNPGSWAATRCSVNGKISKPPPPKNPSQRLPLLSRSKPLPILLFAPSQPPAWLYNHQHGSHSLLPPVLCCSFTWEVPPLPFTSKKCSNQAPPRLVPKPKEKLLFPLVFKGLQYYIYI